MKVSVNFERFKMEKGYSLNAFNAEQRKIIYDNLYAVELTEGCSIGCDFCGLDARIGVGKSILFTTLKQISKEMPSRKIWEKGITLYDATEPLDYEQDGKHYFDVLDLFKPKIKVATSTAVPNGKEELAISRIDDIQQLSISHMNRERLMPYLKGLGIEMFVDLFSYYRAKFGKSNYDQAPFKREFIHQVDGTIEEKVKELRKIDPTLPKKYRFYDLRVDGNRLGIHRQDLKTLFLFCGNSGQYARNGKVFDRDDTQVRNIGRALEFEVFEREYPMDPLEPFGARNGVKITPNGIFNVFSVNPSKKNQAGKLVEPVSPANFRVVKLEHPYHLTNFTSIASFNCVFLTP